MELRLKEPISSFLISRLLCAAGQTSASVRLTVDSFDNPNEAAETLVLNFAPSAGTPFTGPAAQATVTVLNRSNVPPVAADRDIDRGALTAIAVNGSGDAIGGQITLASGALVTVGGDGAFSYDPNNAFGALNDGQFAVDTFEYTLSDGQGGSDEGRVSVRVDGVTSPPINPNPQVDLEPPVFNSVSTLSVGETLLSGLNATPVTATDVTVVTFSIAGGSEDPPYLSSPT